MIIVNELTKRYGKNPVVDHISFNINPGEVVGFLGPNGAGKTTTMRLMTGFLTPSEGTIEIDGMLVDEHALALRKRIGYLPENNPLYDHMRVYEYLRFIAEAKGAEQQDADIKRVVGICQLSEKLASSISDLSKGYRQRVGLAAALLGDPDILLLDEPTSGLDPNQATQLRSVIREIGKKKTVLFSTHILQEVQATCDRAIIINKGKIVAHGTVQELTASAQGKTMIRTVIDGSQETVVSALHALPSVTNVIHTTGQEYTVESTGETDLRPLLFRTCVDHGWTLLELQRTQVSLEDVFRTLTTSTTA